MQTSITAAPLAYSNGTEQGNHPNIKGSKIAEVALSLGQGVIQGTSDDQVKLPAATFTTLAFKGFVILPNRGEKLLTDMTGTTAWDANEQVTIAEDGLFAIKCIDAFTINTQCYVAHTAGVGAPGDLLGASDIGKSDLINAVFQNSGLAGEIALIHITKQV
jgi:hypothetical protein